MELLLESAGVSPWVGGRFNKESFFCNKVVSDCVKWPEIRTVLLGGEEDWRSVELLEEFLTRGQTPFL